MNAKRYWLYICYVGHNETFLERTRKCYGQNQQAGRWISILLFIVYLSSRAMIPEYDILQLTWRCCYYYILNYPPFSQNQLNLNIFTVKFLIQVVIFIFFSCLKSKNNSLILKNICWKGWVLLWIFVRLYNLTRHAHTYYKLNTTTTFYWDKEIRDQWISLFYK